MVLHPVVEGVSMLENNFRNIQSLAKKITPFYIATTGFMAWLISCAVFRISKITFSIFWSLRLEVNPTTQIADRGDDEV
jgi:hypothetical protein